MKAGSLNREHYPNGLRLQKSLVVEVTREVFINCLSAEVRKSDVSQVKEINVAGTAARA